LRSGNSRPRARPARPAVPAKQPTPKPAPAVETAAALLGFAAMGIERIYEIWQLASARTTGATGRAREAANTEARTRCGNGRGPARLRRDGHRTHLCRRG